MRGCCRAERKGVRNQFLYQVREITPEHVFLKDTNLTDAELEWLRLPYAQTHGSCQSTEFEGRVTLHDCQHEIFTHRLLFVGLSRARVEHLVAVMWRRKSTYRQ